MSKGSPLAVVLPWKYSPYQDAVPTWYAFDFGLLVFRVLDTLDTLVAVTSGFVTLAASRLFGPDAAPAPRLATDKTTARPSAKRRRIQLPPRRESRAIGRYAPLVKRSDDATEVGGSCQPERQTLKLTN